MKQSCVYGVIDNVLPPLCSAAKSRNSIVLEGYVNAAPQYNRKMPRV
jgi:hypothetical protein